MTNSAIYVGTLRHRRHVHPERIFVYRVHYAWLDLGELPHVLDDSRLWSADADRWAPFRFRRRDHLRPIDRPLGAVVRDHVEAQLGFRPTGAVRTLTQPAFAGMAFNPITLHYCHDRDDNFRALVAEVTNTPWLERTVYVLPADPVEGVRVDAAKQLHVSPFLPMQLDHRWRVPPPGDRLLVHLSDHAQRDADGADASGGEDPGATESGSQPRPAFDATLNLSRHELTPAAIRRLALRQGPMLLTVVGGIYSQAARLLATGARFHGHPRKQATDPTGRVLDNEHLSAAS